MRYAEPAPLPRKAAAEAEDFGELSRAAEPEAEVGVEAEPAAEAPQPTPRRRKQVAAWRPPSGGASLRGRAVSLYPRRTALAVQ